MLNFNMVMLQGYSEDGKKCSVGWLQMATGEFLFDGKIVDASRSDTTYFQFTNA